MQDYVTYPAQQQVGDAYEQQQSYPSVERSVERIARMTSLTPPPPVEQWSVFEGARARNPYEDEYSLPLPSSTPVHYRQRPAVEDTSATVALLHRVLDDNQRMQRQMMEMQQRLDTRSTPPPPLSSQMPATAQTQVYNAPLTQDHSQLLPPPPPAQVFSFTSPTDTNEYWPPPPPPVSDDFIKPLPPPPPPQTVVSELTGLVRGMTVTPQEQPQHLADLHQTPLRVQTPEYCSPYTPPRYESAHIRPLPLPQHEMVYRGPKPTIPTFTKGDPREFARLKVALENLLPEDATERFKYQILLDHLKHEDALLIADSYINSAQPYTDTMSSLTERYGQPHQLALRKIADLMESSSIARGDTAGFKRFALRVRALVGLLEQLGESGQTELCCGSHVTRLLSKLPQDMRAEFKRFLYPMRVTIPSLLHFSDWLNYELKIQETVYESLHSEVKSSSESKTARRHDNKGNKNTSIFHTTNKPSDAPPTEQVPAIPKRSAFCPYCVNTLHYLDQCGNFALLTVEQRSSWIKSNRRCWRCGRSHQAAQCRLKVTCPKCKGKHLQALHDVNAKPPETPLSPVSSTNEVLYLDRRSGCNQVLLKISRVLLRNGENSLETYAVLDDGSERTILLPAAAQTLKLIGEPEDLALRTVRQDIKVMHGASVSFSISPADQPQKTFTIKGGQSQSVAAARPTLTSSLLGVLLRFREYAVAVCSDIKGMFHQVRLLPEDKTLLCFLWRNLQTEKPPSIYVWQVLPFGTTCSPCCATFALQKHVFDHSQEGEDVRVTIEKSFYVDNCLQSIPTAEEAKHLVDKLKALLAAGGFDLRQWASNKPETIKHLPKEARSESSELWLQESSTDPQELALGLRWLCNSDTLRYKYQLLEPPAPTMRNIYRVLARLYDRGFIVPFTTRAKVLVQRLWDKQREWDDPSLPEDILQPWLEWEAELPHLSQVTLPRCYVSPTINTTNCLRDIHVFADASERAYGSVAYLRSEDTNGQVEVSFLTARSRVAPKKQQSMPRLELCAALTAAQLAALLQHELTLSIDSIFLWTDSTTVLTWLHSDSCRFKLMMSPEAKPYRSCPMMAGGDMGQPSCSSHPSAGRAANKRRAEEDPELRKPAISCLITTTVTATLQSQADQCSSFTDLIETVALSHHGAAPSPPTLTAADYQNAERDILQQVQQENFPEEYNLLSTNKPIPATSRLLTLAPEFDHAAGLIRVGGRLRRSSHLEPETIHPVVLDPHHKVTQLIIQDTDRALCHPGSERLFAELRRKYWILRGREAVKRHQHSCPECQRWRAMPTVPKMSDLPEARLRLLKPPFFSTGMDCFGPFTVKVGRRLEKRWGIVFKCLTTRAVHLDILSSLDHDSFLMALRRFIARRGKPAELLSDQGTNFKGGERELREAFETVQPSLRDHLAKHQIQFKFNPPNAPHFGGVWEREVKSIKAALYATIQPQSVPEEVLRTVLIEVEGILNSKPLGYVSTDVADPDPVTPNLLLMGRLDPSLPQAVYEDAEPLSRRRLEAQSSASRPVLGLTLSEATCRRFRLAQNGTRTQRSCKLGPSSW
ncbi:hypothetical protein WMY93_001798 [Mugilogobius chulae]|uniref:ribonuclease H n=1 Tax=Mugilogobius chulae TaxID=88201 RepID=A0AAW0Q2N3_9GOBI